MAGGAVDALKVPDCFAGFRKVVSQEPATILAVKDAGESPLMTLQRPQIQDLYYQEVTRHGRLAFAILYTKWTTQVVHLQQARWACAWHAADCCDPLLHAAYCY